MISITLRDSWCLLSNFCRKMYFSSYAQLSPVQPSYIVQSSVPFFHSYLSLRQLLSFLHIISLPSSGTSWTGRFVLPACSLISSKYWQAYLFPSLPPPSFHLSIPFLQLPFLPPNAPISKITMFHDLSAPTFIKLRYIHGHTKRKYSQAYSDHFTTYFKNFWNIPFGILRVKLPSPLGYFNGDERKLCTPLTP